MLIQTPQGFASLDKYGRSNIFSYIVCDGGFYCHNVYDN